MKDLSLTIGMAHHTERCGVSVRHDTSTTITVME